MDPITALGVAASVVQLVEIGAKVTKTILAYVKASPGDVPKALVDITVQLPLITKSLSTIESESSIAQYSEDTRFILQGVVLGCLKLVHELEYIASRISPKAGESLSEKLKKVLRSLKNEERVSEIDRGLQVYIQVLILHQVVNPKDVPVGPPAETTYYEVKELRARDAQSRPDFIDKLHRAFSQASRNQLTKPEIVVLAGGEGHGKTQLALEYCETAHRSKHFKAIFWLDASTPESLKAGLEVTSATIRRTRSGTSEEKLDWLKQFLSNLWHSWLLVLDNYEPKSFETEPMMGVLPNSGHGAILVLTRAAQSVQDATEIRIHNAFTETELKRWRYEVTKAVAQKKMSEVVDALTSGFNVDSTTSDVWKDEGIAMVNSAAEAGFAEAVQLLLDLGANPNLKKHYTSLVSCAAASGDVATLKVYLDYEDRTGFRMDDETYSHAAARCVGENNLETLRTLLERRGDRMDRNGKYLAYTWNTGNQWLEIGAREGHLDCMRLLVEKGKLPDSPRDLANILTAAVKGAEADTVSYLLHEIHVDPDQLDHDDEPALIPAIDNHDFLVRYHNQPETSHEIISLLLSQGKADPNTRGEKWGQPPLHLASEKNLPSVVRLLLRHGADPRLEDKKGKLPLESTRIAPEIRDVLLSAPLPPSLPSEATQAYFSRLLHLACKTGDRKLALSCLRKGAGVDSLPRPDPEGSKVMMTPLLSAISHDHLPLARLIVRHDPDIRARDPKGLTPLLLAAGKGMHLLVRDLVEKAKGKAGAGGGRDWDEEVDGDGCSALMLAVKGGHGETVEVLLGLGADSERMNEFGETAGDLAEEMGRGEMVELLEKKG